MSKCLDIETLDWAVCGTIIDLGGWAPWVQAIGTIAAIVVVWIIARKDHRREIRENRLKARSLAIAIYPALLEMRDKFQSARKPDGNIDLDQMLDIPMELFDSMNDLYLLEEAGAQIQQYRALSIVFDRKMRVDKGIKEGIGELRGGWPDALKAELDAMGIALNQAVDLTVKIRDTKV
jgi:hypothetical protein